MARETTYVKINIGAPMNKGVVDISSVRDYIRARSGYQVEPSSSPNWKVMSDGSFRRSRDQEVAIYTFLVPKTERAKIVAHIKHEDCHLVDVLPDD